MIAAGLLARKALSKGLSTRNWVKTSFTPGSKVVSDYLLASGLQSDLDGLGFNLAGYGCASCGGGSGPLSPDIQSAVDTGQLTVSAVLSGNRNFEGRIHPLARANYLLSPALVVAYAIAGSVRIDLTRDPLGRGPDGSAVFLSDIWPDNEEIREIEQRYVTPDRFRRQYSGLGEGDAPWQELPSAACFTGGIQSAPMSAALPTSRNALRQLDAACRARAPCCCWETASRQTISHLRMAYGRILLRDNIWSSRGLRPPPCTPSLHGAAITMS
jgi:aconitase A